MDLPELASAFEKAMGDLRSVVASHEGVFDALRSAAAEDARPKTREEVIARISADLDLLKTM